MGKPSAERRLDDTEASAFLRALRISPRKLNLVAQSIRGKDAAKALAELIAARLPGRWKPTSALTKPAPEVPVVVGRSRR